MVPYEVPILELIRALPVFLSPVGESGNMAWRHPIEWFLYALAIVAPLALPTAFFGVVFGLLWRRLRARGSHLLAIIVWSVLGLELGLAFFIWLMGYWLLAVPIGILVIVVWILA